MLFATGGKEICRKFGNYIVGIVFVVVVVFLDIVFKVMCGSLLGVEVTDG